MKRVWGVRVDKTLNIVRTGGQINKVYILFGSLDREPDREIHVVIPAEQMKELFEKYQALESEALESERV